MVEIIRDLNRLNLLGGDQGLEAWGLPGQIQDFFRYYFGRFLSNLCHVFSPFAGSQIARWCQRHRLDSRTLGYQLSERGHVLVPIPLGMVHSYSQTVKEIIHLFDQLQRLTILSDVNSFTKNLEKGTAPTSPTPFDQKAFEQQQHHLGKLFTQMGLTHRIAKDVLESPGQILATVAQLTTLTNQVYGDIIAVNKSIKQLEAAYQRHQWSPEDSYLVKTHCLSLGYRLTMFAILADHLQKLEHQFVQSLEIITKTK